MTTAVEPDLPTTLVLGPTGLTRDLAEMELGVYAGMRAAAGGEPPALVVLVDPSAPDWDTARALGVPVILLSGHPLDDQAVARAVLRGADAVVDADSRPEQLLEVARIVLEGGSVLGPRQARALADAARSGVMAGSRRLSLTAREQQILESIERGEPIKRTAQVLGISVKTVESLQGRLFCKLGVRNRAEAVAIAHGLGLVTGGAVG